MPNVEPQAANAHKDVYKDLCTVLERYLNPISCRSVLRTAMARVGLSETGLNRTGINPSLIQEIEQRLSSYNLSRARCLELLNNLKNLTHQASAACASPSSDCVERVAIKDEADVVAARRAAREISAKLGFQHTDQIKLTTVVSELARNIYKYAKQGAVILTAIQQPSKGLRVEAIDQGPGIPNVAEILSGTYRSKTGMGLGIWGCKNLMDAFSINSSSSGTHLSMELYL